MTQSRCIYLRDNHGISGENPEKGEKEMKLTKSELELIRSIPRKRKSKVQAARISLLFVPICAYLIYDGYDGVALLSAIMAILIVNFVKVRYALSTEDQLMTLIEKYANQDSDALENMSS